MTKGARFTLTFLFFGGVLFAPAVFAQTPATPATPPAAATTPATTPTTAPATPAATTPATPATPPVVPPIPITLGVPIGGVTQVEGLGQYINIGYRYLVSVILIIAIVMVVWGGFRYLLGSSLGSVNRGKEIIRDAIVGMLLVISAYVILNVLNPNLTTLRNPNLGSIVGQGINVGVADSTQTECTSDASCPSGQHCVEVGFVFNTDEDAAFRTSFGSGAVGALAGGYVTRSVYGVLGGGAAGLFYGAYQALGHTAHRCTTGERGSPCSENNQCAQGYCLMNWHLCGIPGPQPNGSMCQIGADCQNGACESVGGYQSLFEGEPKTCRGQQTLMTAQQYRDNGFKVVSARHNYECFQNADCQAGEHLVCGGPSGLHHAFCIYATTYINQELHFYQLSRAPSAGDLCFLYGSGGIYPPGCEGNASSPLTCMFCPTTGGATWQRLRAGSDPDSNIIGTCHPASSLNTDCGRPSSP